jgi:plastocyanin
MAVRDIYLKIEPIPDYSPVEPDPHAAIPYRRDCMRTPGHENAMIPIAEVNARKLTALVYREYLDANYLIPKPDKIVLADVNEPAFHHRIPGTVVWARPGDRLRIHVLNGDEEMPHSLHMHGLRYGIDSDGSWPLGTQSSDGRRSDEICPGDSWTYTFDVTDEMVGAWPFHDHWQHVAASINRGLFGGVIVLPRRVRQPPPLKLPKGLQKQLDELAGLPLHELRRPRPGPVPGHGPPGPHGPAGGGHMPGGGMPPGVGGFHPQVHPLIEFLGHLVQVPDLHPLASPGQPLHVPLFFHFLDRGAAPAFRSGTLAAGQQYQHVFPDPGVFSYFCEIHGPSMSGIVRVDLAGSMLVNVNVIDNQFVPADVTVAPGGTVRWTNVGPSNHTATETASVPSYCFNGRSFVGNTPTILTRAGQRIRWYVFNLDLGMNWHNFHPHAQRWTFAGETIDGRSLGPAESFVVETTAPDVLLLPTDIDEAQKRPAKDADPYETRADFLFHCHVEMHMMGGMAGLVRSRQTYYFTPEQAERVANETGIPLDSGLNDCPPVDLGRCGLAAAGVWEEVVGDPEVTFMHAALLPDTTKVLYWGYTRADQARLWDYATATYSAPTNQPADVAPTPGDINTSNLWSAEHAFLDTPQGLLLAHGGFSPNQSYVFDPSTLSWSLSAPTAQDRFYATTFTLGDGRVLTLYGSASQSIEVYTHGVGWAPPIPLPATFNYLYYPWTHLLPDGEIFVAGPPGETRKVAWTATPVVDDPAKRWNTIAGTRSFGGEKGSSVLMPLRPPSYEPRVLIAGGSSPAAEQTAEMIDLSAALPAWTSLPNLNTPRPEQFTATLLPDGRVFVAGGVIGSGGPAEIFDPENPAAGWQLGPPMTYVRGYHSSSLLLPDGSVLVGGDPQGAGGPTPHERFFPGYCFQTRPTVVGAPATVNYGATFSIQSPDAPQVADVVLVRPGATTHGFNMSQRFVGCAITGGTAVSVDVKAPPTGNVAPPGWYLLFVLNASRVPSIGRWIRLTP